MISQSKKTALTKTLSPSLCTSVQLAAQVLDDFDDEDIGFGLVDEKKDSAVAKKLGKLLMFSLNVSDKLQYIKQVVISIENRIH